MRKKICFVVAVPITANAFLTDHIKALSKEYDVYLVASISSTEDIKDLTLTGWKNINIERGISFFKDICSVFRATRYFKRMKFDAVHSVTPKAGLVTALAGKMAGIKHRTHIFTGQVWATRTGIMRWLLKSIDKVIAKCDNHILVDGKSQRSFLVKEGVLREGEADVFRNGSISGVNSQRFAPDIDARNLYRTENKIKDDTLCYIYLGRLNHDKGIGELLSAYDRIAREEENVYLIIIGHDEEGYIKKLSSYKSIIEGENFHYYGVSKCPEKILCAGDVFVLPTYREGFGTSVLEAACVGLPCISSDAYGVLDVYVEGETGLKCKVGDAESLYECMRKFYDHPEMIKKMGVKSRERVLRDFDGVDLTACWVDFYHNIFFEKG